MQVDTQPPSVMGLSAATQPCSNAGLLFVTELLFQSRPHATFMLCLFLSCLIQLSFRVVDLLNGVVWIIPLSEMYDQHGCEDEAVRSSILCGGSVWGKGATHGRHSGSS